mmetsp:Transcript_43191/g.90463  ORF Transcript_43191/g.90463 Transcript_43191/m.90463 type:complete len:86 (+) Transcript_43191:640-897(+)
MVCAVLLSFHYHPFSEPSTLNTGHSPGLNRSKRLFVQIWQETRVGDGYPSDLEPGISGFESTLKSTAPPKLALHFLIILVSEGNE